MGRRELPISSTKDPVAHLAVDLRALRRQAGSPTYRQMAARVHFSASALSQAANGQRLPTLPVLLAFVAACGGEEDEWTRRWHEVAAGDSGVDDEEPPVEPAAPRPRRRYREALVAIVAGVVAAASAVVVAVALHHPVHRGPVTAASGTPGRQAEGQQDDLPAQPVVDGADPKRTGCASDGVTLDSTSLFFPAQRLAGTVELRYSPRCAAAWARFVPAPTGRGANDTVTLVIFRPAGPIRLPFTISYGDEAVYSDMLLTMKGCVSATASIVSDGSRSPEVSTGCRTG